MLHFLEHVMLLSSVPSMMSAHTFSTTGRDGNGITDPGSVNAEEVKASWPAIGFLKEKVPNFMAKHLDHCATLETLHWQPDVVQWSRFHCRIYKLTCYWEESCMCTGREEPPSYQRWMILTGWYPTFNKRPISDTNISKSHWRSPSRV